MCELLLNTTENFGIGLRLDLAGRCAGTLGALLVGAVGTLCLVEREDLLTLVARVIGVLLTKYVVGVAVGELVELRSVMR